MGGLIQCKEVCKEGGEEVLDVNRRVWGSDEPVGLEKEGKKEQLFISQCGGDAGAETHYTLTSNLSLAFHTVEVSLLWTSASCGSF